MVNFMDETKKNDLKALLIDLSIHEVRDLMKLSVNNRDRDSYRELYKVEEAIDTLMIYIDK